MTDTARTLDDTDQELRKLAWELVRASVKELDQALQGLDPAIDLQPSRDRVLVTLIPEDYVAGSGLILAVGEKAPWRAMVLAVGPKVNQFGEEEAENPQLLKRGDTVVVDHITGQTIPHLAADEAGLELRLIQAADILAVFKEAV